MTNLPKADNLHYQGLRIDRQPETGLVCLTDMWKAQCSPAKNRPLTWVCLESTQELLKRLVRKTGTVPVWSERKQKDNPSGRIVTEIPAILETTREGGLRTYSTPELAVVYARFLAVECYEWALTALVEGSEEGANLVEQQIQKEAKSEGEKQFTRRALIAAGWAVPVILTVGLAQSAGAQVSSAQACGNEHNNWDQHGDSSPGGCHDDFNVDEYI